MDKQTETLTLTFSDPDPALVRDLAGRTRPLPWADFRRLLDSLDSIRRSEEGLPPGGDDLAPERAVPLGGCLLRQPTLAALMLLERLPALGLDGAGRAVATAYCLHHARDPEALLALGDAATARPALADFAPRCTFTAAELDAAAAALLRGLAKPPDPDADPAKKKAPPCPGHASPGSSPATQAAPPATGWRTSPPPTPSPSGETWSTAPTPPTPRPAAPSPTPAAAKSHATTESSDESGGPPPPGPQALADALMIREALRLLGHPPPTEAAE